MFSKGQSTIEFLLVFIFVLGMTVTFSKIATLYTNGYLVHYATYLASRAYMVFDHNSNMPDGSDDKAKELAEKVFHSFNIFKLLSVPTKLPLQINDPQSFLNAPENLYVGVWTQFKQVLPVPKIGKGRAIDLRSESFLGRSPTRSECLERICEGMREVTNRSSYCDLHATHFDNGC